MKGIGLYVEENAQEIISRFFATAAGELGHLEPALKLAAPILLQDLARAARRGVVEAEPWRRAVLLVVSQPEGGVRGLVREFGLLRRAVWESMTDRGHAVPSQERRWLDRQLDEAAAFAAERWAAMARILTPTAVRARRDAPSREPPPLPCPPPANLRPMGAGSASSRLSRPPPLPELEPDGR